MKKSVTISDLAIQLGVSKSSVSHALSGKRRISPELCARVAEAVRLSGYRPNFAAQVMHTKCTGLVGILVEGLLKPNTIWLLNAINNQLALHSCRMVLSVVSDVAEAHELLRKFSDGVVDGVINTVPGLDDHSAHQAAGELPLITFLRHDEARVTIDYAAGVRAAMQHLYELGHRDIALIGLPARWCSEDCDPCVAAYLAIQAARGATAYRIDITDGVSETGYRIAPEVFRLPVTAVLAGNDLVAAGLIQWATEQRVALPDALSIVGYDDTALVNTMISPRLTTVHLPMERLAAHTVQLLMHRINAELPPPAPLTVKPELIIRQSSQSPASIPPPPQSRL